MAEDNFKARRRITPNDLDSSESGPVESPLENIKKMQQAMAKETGVETPRPFEAAAAPFDIGGNIPPEFKRAMANRNVENRSPPQEAAFDAFEAPPERKRPKPVPDSQVPKAQGSDALENLLGKLQQHHQWEPFEFPSKGKFYSNIPATIHIRAMTGEEEQILATPRWVKKGKAIDMIFRRCIKEEINTEDLLSSDRTHLLIYLRGISYTPEYDVEIKCPNCSIKFAHVINLDEIEIEECPNDFGPDSLKGVLPVSKFSYSFRMATGQDEQEIQNYREKRIQQWGDTTDDDTLLYRTALLLEEIEGVTMKKELAVLLKKLPIQDVAHLRNEINNPPFGVDTQLDLLCPGCNDEFKIDLPLETNFFFPRKRLEKTQA